MRPRCRLDSLFFFFDTATTEIYTLSLHDALPIAVDQAHFRYVHGTHTVPETEVTQDGDRKSTRLNSSHVKSSYAVFCLKKNNDLEKVDDFLDAAAMLDLLALGRTEPQCLPNHVAMHLQRPPSRDVVELFFFNDTATTEIYTLSLHDALPI